MSVVGMAPSVVFEALVDVLKQHYGADWLSQEGPTKQFAVGAEYFFEGVEGIHLVGTPEREGDELAFHLWLDFPIEHVLEADEVAFEIFARIAEDVFCCCRVIEERTVRYRFVTGSANHGHLGSLIMTGPFAVDFVRLHRTRIARGLHYQA